MSRKPSLINPECGKRVKLWISEVGITQKECSERLPYPQQHLSLIINGKKSLNPHIAKLISEKIQKPFFNSAKDVIGYERVRAAWLLCLDDLKTENDWADNIEKKRDLVFNSEWNIIDAAAQKHDLKIILSHPFPNPPQYIDLITSQKTKCKFIIKKGDTAIREYDVFDFINLTQKLEKYAEFLIWEQTEGTYNG